MSSFGGNDKITFLILLCQTPLAFAFAFAFVRRGGKGEGKGDLT